MTTPQFGIEPELMECVGSHPKSNTGGRMRSIKSKSDLRIVLRESE